MQIDFVKLPDHPGKHHSCSLRASRCRGALGRRAAKRRGMWENHICKQDVIQTERIFYLNSRQRLGCILGRRPVITCQRVMLYTYQDSLSRFSEEYAHSLLSPLITLFTHVMWFLMAGRIPHLLSIKLQNGMQWHKSLINRCKVSANSILSRRRQKLREWSPLILAVLGPWRSLYRVRWRIAAAICIQTYWRGSCARAKAHNDGPRDISAWATARPCNTDGFDH